MEGLGWLRVEEFGVVCGLGLGALYSLFHTRTLCRSEADST